MIQPLLLAALIFMVKDVVKSLMDALHLMNGANEKEICLYYNNMLHGLCHKYILHGGYFFLSVKYTNTHNCTIAMHNSFYSNLRKEGISIIC